MVFVLEVTGRGRIHNDYKGVKFFCRQERTGIRRVHVSKTSRSTLVRIVNLSQKEIKVRSVSRVYVKGSVF